MCLAPSRPSSPPLEQIEEKKLLEGQELEWSEQLGETERLRKENDVLRRNAGQTTDLLATLQSKAPADGSQAAQLTSQHCTCGLTPREHLVDALPGLPTITFEALLDMSEYGCQRVSPNSLLREGYANQKAVVLAAAGMAGLPASKMHPVASKMHPVQCDTPPPAPLACVRIVRIAAMHLSHACGACDTLTLSLAPRSWARKLSDRFDAGDRGGAEAGSIIGDLGRYLRAVQVWLWRHRHSRDPR
jgi:hypothetical protein